MANINVVAPAAPKVIANQGGATVSFTPNAPRGPRGKSAYEVAVDAGFAGTEEQWLDSIASGGGEGSSFALDTHIASTTPHPHYDDLPSLTLLFENGLI